MYDNLHNLNCMYCTVWQLYTTIRELPHDWSNERSSPPKVSHIVSNPSLFFPSLSLVTIDLSFVNKDKLHFLLTAFQNILCVQRHMKSMCSFVDPWWLSFRIIILRFTWTFGVWIDFIVLSVLWHSQKIRAKGTEISSMLFHTYV